MAKKLRGTTTKAGKVTTVGPATVAADRIERPHGKGTVEKVGAQTEVEAQGLTGRHGKRAGSVEEVGPSDIQNKQSSTGSVETVGEGHFEDQQAARGGFLPIPYSRQGGAVEQVGPSDRGYARALEGTGTTGSFRSGRLPRTNRIISGVTLLVSGSGRAYDFGKYVGGPGTVRGRSAVGSGAFKESILVSGRRRSKTPPPQPEEEQVQVPDGPTIV